MSGENEFFKSRAVCITKDSSHILERTNGFKDDNFFHNYF